MNKSKISRQKEQPVNTHSDTWDLRLYVAGERSKSVTAMKNLKLICEEQLEGKYHIKVINILKNPQAAHDHQIVALPTLIRTFPLPPKRIIGDLSNTESALVALDLM